MPPTQYKPGEIVPRSGQYAVVGGLRALLLGREVTCVRGERFPPAPAGCGFVLTDPTSHW